MARKDQAKRWISKIQESLQYIQYAAKAAISWDQSRFDRFLKKSHQLPTFKTNRVNFTTVEDPFRSRVLTRDAIMTVLADKQEQLVGLDDLIENLERNSELVSDHLAVTDERGVSVQ